MKKILLGLVAAFALTSFVAPVMADDAPAAGGDAAAKPMKAKKGKKAKKDAAAPAADADAKPAK